MLNIAIFCPLTSTAIAVPGTMSALAATRTSSPIVALLSCESVSIRLRNYVKTRFHRARVLIQRELYAAAGEKAATAFQFLGVRCDRVVTRVMNRIREKNSV